MRRIVEYRLVERNWTSDKTRGETDSYINSEVNALLDQGWELYGSPFEHDRKIAQAMVRYEGGEIGMAFQAETLQALIQQVEDLQAELDQFRSDTQVSIDGIERQLDE